MEHGPSEQRFPPAIKDKARKDRSLSDVVGGAPQKLLNWKLDWRTYFHNFCAFHGGNPVEINGRLVLPDGWSYSSTDYKGPEWPPPPEPALSALLIKYWQYRAGIVGSELKLLRETRRTMIEQMVNRSVPLVKKIKTFDEMAQEGRQWSWQSDQLTTEPLDNRIKWLDEDLALAESKLTELKGENHEQESDSKAQTVS